mmetsp:Transcript_33900/g.71155  ORF Transcript_33900/g.71155 Transcript_33900/m.71155 type:complete len:1058 (-) Transcript_33900:248-3421(-)
MQNEQQYYGSGHGGHYQNPPSNYTAAPYGQAEYRGPQHSDAPQGGGMEESSFDTSSTWWHPSQGADEELRRGGVARQRPVHPEDQGGPQGLGGPGPCGMALGYGGGAPAYPEGSIRPQHAPDAGRGGYSTPSDSVSRGPTASGMDPSSGGWYHSGHTGHYPPDTGNFPAYHTGALPLSQGNGIPPSQGGLPPPQSAMPPQSTMPPQTPMQSMPPQISMPQHSLQPPQAPMPQQGNIQLKSGILPPQSGMPPPQLGGMPPPLGMSPAHNSGMGSQGGNPYDCGYATTSAGVAGMQPPPQGMLQSMQPSMQHPIGAMQPQQRVMQSPVVMKPLPQGVPQPHSGMPPMNPGKVVQGEESGGYMNSRMGHGGQSQMSGPHQNHHVSGPHKVQSRDSSYQHVFQPAHQQQQSSQLQQPQMQGHQPTHSSNYQASAHGPKHGGPKHGAPHSYAAQHDAASSNGSQHSYPPQHQPAQFAEHQAPLQTQEQVLPPRSSSVPSQPQGGATRLGPPSGMGSASSGGVSVDAGAWTTPDPVMLFHPPEAIQALQRMATDLLGPNDWGKLPPEQLWNVLKVTVEHSFSNSKSGFKTEGPAQGQSRSGEQQPPSQSPENREAFPGSGASGGAMARSREAASPCPVSDEAPGSASSTPGGGPTGSGGRGCGANGSGSGGAAAREDEHQRRLQILQEVDQYQSYMNDVVRESEIFNEAEEQEEAREMENSLMQIRRTSSGRAYPIPSNFIMKGVATGVSVLFPSMEKNGLIDIDVLVQHCPCPLHLDGSQIVGLAGGSTLLERGKQSKSKTRGQARQGKEPDKDAAALLPPDKAGNRMQHACTVNMMLAGGGDYVSVKVYSNGKTQTTGCKSIDMVYMANRLLLEALRAIAHLDYPDAKARPCLHVTNASEDRSALQELVSRAVEKPSEAINLIKAPVQGVFDCGFKGVGVKLDMKALCEYLSTPKHASKVALIKECRQEGNSSRFKQLCLYVRREAVPSWKDSDGGQATAYVALFDTGKCNINAAPNETVAHEIATVVSEMLLDAFGQDHIRLRLDEEAEPAPKRPKSDPA